jgi:hypothetical protein
MIMAALDTRKKKHGMHKSRDSWFWIQNNTSQGKEENLAPSPFPADAQNGPETTQLWRKFAQIARVSAGFACGAGGLACGAS